MSLMQRYTRWLVTIGLMFVLGVPAAQGRVRGRAAYMTVVKKFEGQDSRATYLSHVQKGDVILIQTLEKGPGGPGGGDMHRLYIINAKTHRLYELRDPNHMEPVFTLENSYFNRLVIDSPLKVRFRLQSTTGCIDYKAVYQPKHQVYQPIVLKEYAHC